MNVLLWAGLIVVLVTSKVFGEDGQLRHFVDGRGSGSSWMSYVNCARCAAEQNLDMIQTRDGSIYYDVIDDIACDTELLVITLRHTHTSLLSRCGDPTTSPTRLPASIGCALMRESSSRSPYWHSRPRTLRRGTSALLHVSPTYPVDDRCVLSAPIAW